MDTNKLASRGILAVLVTELASPPVHAGSQTSAHETRTAVRRTLLPTAANYRAGNADHGSIQQQESLGQEKAAEDSVGVGVSGPGIIVRHACSRKADSGPSVGTLDVRSGKMR